MIRILVIDYAPLARAIADVLINFGHEAQVAKNGQEGLEILKTSPIDIVLIENEGTDMSGSDFIRATKTAYPKLRFILTGQDYFFPGYRSLADAAKACGADGFLTKVFGFKGLEQMIQALVGDHQPRPQR